MSDGEFHRYVALLAIGALALAVPALAGRRQPAGARFAEGAAGCVFLGYAVYLTIANPPTVLYYSFPVWAAPTVAVLSVLASMRRTASARREPHALSEPRALGERRTRGRRSPGSHRR